MRTYSSRVRQAAPSTKIAKSAPSTSSLTNRKRPLQNTPVNTVTNHFKPTKSIEPPPSLNQKAFTQLHFCVDQASLRTCPICDLSYTKGAPDDETLHRAHCTRVQKGMEWGRDEEREGYNNGISEAGSRVQLKNGAKGRIISFPADAGGKIGTKLQLATLLHTINISLSAPALSPTVLQASKAYLFLLPQERNPKRERIVGCVIAQRIMTAMEIVHNDIEEFKQPNNSRLVTVDVSTGLFCHPEPLATPLGISRLFVSSTHRRKGIAQHLLSAAAETFIHGCPLDPRKGQVAFTQPTGDGTKLMRSWGGGRVRIYEDH